MYQFEKKLRCRCRGHGAPEIVDPCIRELVDCLNRHGVKTISSCCGHGGPGAVVLSAEAIEPNSNGGWILNLAPRQVVLPYSDETGDWEDEYPVGGRNLSAECHALNMVEDGLKAFEEGRVTEPLSLEDIIGDGGDGH